MLKEDGVVEISVLKKQGYSLRDISKMSGHAVNTIQKYLKGAQVGYKCRVVSTPRKLEDYTSYIIGRIKAAFPHWIPASVIFREIKAMGYTGQIRQLQYFMANHKPQAMIEPLVRFETKPGEQMQVDWAHFSYLGTKLYAFVAILGYSRMAYVVFRQDMTIDTLLQCHQHAFDYFGGVSSHILYDNMKTVVIARNAYGQGIHRFHPKLYDFAKHYGFSPRLCRPYRARTKGKVERFIHYLRNSFFTPFIGRLNSTSRCLDIQTLNLEVRYWLDEVANVRSHRTIQAKPIEYYQIEVAKLQPLPPRGYLQLPAIPPLIPAFSWPIEHLQHDLQVYEALFIGGAA